MSLQNIVTITKVKEIKVSNFKWDFLLKKAVHIIKSNWGWLSVVLVPAITAVFIWFNSKNSSLSDAFKAAREQKKKEVKKAKEKRVDSLKKRAKLIEKYDDAIKQVEEKYNFKDFKKVVKNKTKEKAEEYKEDPESFIKEIADMYGLELSKEDS